MESHEVWVPLMALLGTLLPLGTVGVILGSIAIITYHRRSSQTRRIGGNLVHEMLQRGMSADDIERVLIAWHADPQLASKLLKGDKPRLKAFG